MNRFHVSHVAVVATLMASACCSNGSAVATGATTTAGAGGSSSSTGSGGAGGSSDGGGGAGGGAPVTCLDSSIFEAYFTVEGAVLCAVAAYDAEVALGFDANAGFYFRAPTWGRHGGPLTMDPGANGAVDIVRWELPGGATGDLIPSHATVDIGIPGNAYLGAHAVDVPSLDLTTMGWAGQFPATQGSLVLTDGATLTKSYGINGIFAVSALGGPEDTGRVLYTGLSELENENASLNGLYAGDACAASQGLTPEGAAECAAPTLIASWGDASGPVAVDTQGNVFAVMPTFANLQTARGFAASTIAPGSGPAAGDLIFSLPGFGSALAAMAPTDDDPGLLVFQPNAGTDPYDALDAVVVEYTAEGGTIVPKDEPSPLLRLTAPNTALALFTDGAGRLWVGVRTPEDATTFFVFVRSEEN